VERSRKEKIVNDLHDALESANMVVVTHNNGLTVAEATELRRSMRDAGASFKVTKNRLALRALDGTPYEALRELFSGPTAVTTSEDPVAAAKAAIDYAKKNEKLVVIGGAMGATVLDAAGVKQLASLPSLDALRSTLIGLIQAPATKVAGVLQAPAGQLARVFSAYGDTGTDG
jgi:large subunit ribosomal protein L10